MEGKTLFKNLSNYILDKLGISKGLNKYTSLKLIYLILGPY